MKNFTKILISIFISMVSFIGINIAAVDFPYTETDFPTNQNTDFSSDLKSNIADEHNWFYLLFHMFMPNDSMYWWSNSPSFLFYLKTIVNLLLSFVSLIALILMIYAFYMIFFKKDEAGFTTAKQMIKWIAIAIVVIWLSRIIVSFLFRFENKNTQNIWYNNSEITTNLTQNYLNNKKQNGLI